MAKMWPCPSQNHRLTDREFLLRFCEKCPGISIPHLKTNKDATNMCSTICLHFYCNASRCNVKSYAHMNNKQCDLGVTLILVM